MRFHTCTFVLLVAAVAAAAVLCIPQPLVAASAACLTQGRPLRIVDRKDVVIDGFCPDGKSGHSGKRNAPFSILVKNARRVTIKNLSLTVDARADSAVTIVNAGDVVIENNQFRGGKKGKALILIRSVDGGTVDNITIRDNTFTDSPAVAIVVDSWKFNPQRKIENIVIERNRFEKIFQAVRFVQSAAYSQAANRPRNIRIVDNTLKAIDHVGILAIWGGGDRSEIADNILEDICRDTDKKCNAVSCEYCDGGSITGNRISTVGNCAGCRGDGAGIILDWEHKDPKYLTTNVTVSRNRIDGCRHALGGGGIILWKADHTAVFSNQISDSRIGIILSNPETTDNLVYNNDVRSSDAGIQLKQKTGNNAIYNNQVVENRMDVTDASGKGRNAITNNYYQTCEGCDNQANIQSRQRFTADRCSGGKIDGRERRPFTDIAGKRPSRRPIGAEDCP